MPTTSLSPSTYGQAVTFTATASGAGGTPAGTITFYDGATPLGTATLNGAGMASLTTTMVAVGTRSITAVYSGNGQYTGSTSPARTQTVNIATAAATQTISAASLQYSDRETYEVTVTGANGEAPAQGVYFKMGTQQMNATPVPFVSMGGGTWKATYANRPVLETTPGALLPSGATRGVTVTYSGKSANYTLASPTAKAVILTKEDGRVTYTGPATAQTGGGNTTTIELKVKVKDISNTAEANGDTSPGDIRLAKVSFINRATGAILGTVDVVTDPEDPNNGLATFNWVADIGANPSQTFTIGFALSNYYTRNDPADNVSITVSR